MATAVDRLVRLGRDRRLVRVYALIDQGVQGLANIVAAAALGRALPADQFGVIGVMIGIYYVVAGFHRSAVVLPYITEQPVPTDPVGARLYHSDWWWLSVAAAVLLSLCLVALAGVVRLAAGWQPNWQWAVTPLLLGALVTPPLLWAEHARRLLYKVDRPGAVAVVALCYAVAMVGTAVLVARIHPTALGGSIAWVAAGTVGAVAALTIVAPAAPSLRRSLDCFGRHRRFASWLSLTIVPYTVYSSATVVILIGIFNGPLAAAVFTAARTLTNPAISIVSAADSIDKPRAAAALATGGMAGLRAQIARSRRMLMAMTGTYLAAVALLAGPLLRLAFHHRYDGIDWEVRVLAGAFFLFCLNQPSETQLIVLRASDTMFVTRSVTAVVTLGLLIAASSYGVMGMAVAIGMAQALNFALLLVAEHWVARHRGPAA